MKNLGAGKVAHMVESLPSKHETLSSNPSTTKKKKTSKLGIRVHIYSPSYSRDGGKRITCHLSLCVQDQPRQQSETLSQKKKKM
jgi:hypothetical protein